MCQAFAHLHDFRSPNSVAYMTDLGSTPYGQALRSTSARVTDDDVTQALQGLQPSLHALRQGFNDGARSSSVSSDYSGKIAEAYLIAYVPGFIKQAETAFKLAELRAQSPPPKRVGVFCCGPCPEVVALGELFSGSQSRPSRDRLGTACPACFLSPKVSVAKETGECSECGAPLQIPPRNESELRIQLELFDLSPQSWKPIRDEVLRIAIGNAKRASVDLSCVSLHEFDIRDPESVERHSGVVADLDVAIFQNFQNELGNAREVRSAVHSNLESVARLLRPGSKMILSDLWHAMADHSRLTTLLSGLGAVQRWNQTVTHPMPNLFLRDHFFFQTPNCQKTNPRGSHTANFLLLNRTDDASSGQEGC